MNKILKSETTFEILQYLFTEGFWSKNLLLFFSSIRGQYLDSDTDYY